MEYILDYNKRCTNCDNCIMNIIIHDKLNEQFVFRKKLNDAKYI